MQRWTLIATLAALLTACAPAVSVNGTCVTYDSNLNRFKTLAVAIAEALEAGE